MLALNNRIYQKMSGHCSIALLLLIAFQSISGIYYIIKGLVVNPNSHHTPMRVWWDNFFWRCYMEMFCSEKITELAGAMLKVH